jgi:hypothetical protein
MTPAQRNIVEYLQVAEEKGLTVFELIRFTKQNDVRKRISELREDGYPITSQWEGGSGKRWKRYFYAISES